MGKGSKYRDVPIPAKTMAEMTKRYQAIKPKDNDPLLIDRLAKRMGKSGLLQRVVRMGEAVGIPVHPHALRRAYVTINANNGVSLKALQITCGHSDLSTTSSYCRTTMDEAIEIVKSVDW